MSCPDPKACKNGRHFVTPRISKTSQDRLRLFVSCEDVKQIEPMTDKRALKRVWKATVKDLDTKTIYRMESAARSLPGCYCDAVLMELPT